MSDYSIYDGWSKKSCDDEIPSLYSQSFLQTNSWKPEKLTVCASWETNIAPDTLELED